MRFRELYESDKGWPASLSKEHYDMWPILQKECSDIIKVYNESKKFLYRGFKSGRSNNFYFKGHARKDRLPLDTSIKVHKAIDKVLVDLDIPVLRSNSYFVIADKEKAHFYGKTYIIFPINGYDYLWFKNSSDLFKVTNLISIALSLSKTESFKRIKEIILNEKPTLNQDMPEAIKKVHEVMFTGSYYAVYPPYFDTYLRNKIF